MAKATAKLTCGKCGRTYEWTTTHYNRTQADNWLSRTDNTTGLCPECWAADQKAKREAEIAAQKAKTPETEAQTPLALPELQGSEKQVSWARDIRAQFLDALAGMKWDLALASDEPRVKAEIAKIMEPSARWWIDNRNGTIFGRYAEA